jgi:F-type H+-transporting ATPase subunit b
MSSSRQFWRTSALALLLLGCAGFIPVRAQVEPPAPVRDQSFDQNKQRSAGPAHQLAHESREAAGEETDEMEEFKHSASVQAISRLTGLNTQQSYWLSIILNFAVIAGVIIWAGRKYLPGIFRDRTAAIQKAMREAQEASAEARRKLAEIDARLQKIDGEIATMRAAAEKEGAAEEARIQAAAQQEARRIVTSAEQEIAAAAKAARRQLTAHAADLAVGLAEKQIRVDSATDQVLVRNFAGQLGSANENFTEDGN